MKQRNPLKTSKCYVIKCMTFNIFYFTVLSKNPVLTTLAAQKNSKHSFAESPLQMIEVYTEIMKCGRLSEYSKFYRLFIPIA
jgi:hypothetical protein